MEWAIACGYITLLIVVGFLAHDKLVDRSSDIMEITFSDAYEACTATFEITQDERAEFLVAARRLTTTEQREDILISWWIRQALIEAAERLEEG